MNLQDHKIIVGSSNTFVYEDPILGSNGTAVVTKINSLIDELEVIENLPVMSKGSILTSNSTQNLELTVGNNNLCLVANSSSSLGLSYQERVDLVSTQSIGGLKTFQEELIAESDLTIYGNVTALNLSGINTGDEPLATTTVAGKVKISSEEADPVVYIKEEADSIFIKQDQIGVAEGIASLDENGKVFEDQLPTKTYKVVIGQTGVMEYTINHMLNSDVIVQTVELSTGSTVYTDVTRPDNNTVVISTASAIDQDSIKVIILSV